MGISFRKGRDDPMTAEDRVNHAVTPQPPDLQLGPLNGSTSPYPRGGQPAVYAGGENSFDNQPITFTRYTNNNTHLVQLSNGWQNTNYGKRLIYKGSGYLNEVVPRIPGQTRLYGGPPNSFVPRGNAPAQWQANVDNGPGMQPESPGGPGQMLGTNLRNPGSGG